MMIEKRDGTEGRRGETKKRDEGDEGERLRRETDKRYAVERRRRGTLRGIGREKGRGRSRKRSRKSS